MSASTDLIFNIIGKPDSAVSAMDKVSKSGENAKARVSKAFKGIAIAAGAAFGGGLAAIIKTGWDEAKDAAAGTAQLAAGIKSTGNAANVTVDGLNDLASEIQNYSGQTDDSIVKSEQLLLTFTNIHNAAGKNNDIFTQATKITADMAAKMGTDASASAVTLGKALNDPVKGISALTRVGVTFSAAQQKQIKSMVASGDTMGAQKVILGELSKEFGGAAKAAGDSLPGKLARAKRSFEDVSQSVVENLMPIITKLADFLTNDVMPAFSKIVNFIMANKTVFAILGAAIGTIVVAVKAWTIAQAAFNLVMEANPILLVATAIAALAAGLVVAYQRSETFRKIVQGTFSVISAAASVLWNDVLKPIFKLWQIQIAAMVATFKGLRSAVGFVGDAFRVAYDTAKRYIGNIVSAVTGLPGKIASIAGKMLKAGKDLMGSLWDGIKSVAGQAGGLATDIGKTIANKFIDFVNIILPIKVPKIRIGAFGHYVSVGGQTLIGEIPHLAQGTGFFPGGEALVGENGPEIVRMPRGGKVLPSSQTESLLGRGGGSTTVIEVNVAGSVISENDLVGVLERVVNRGVKIHIANGVV